MQLTTISGVLPLKAGSLGGVDGQSFSSVLEESQAQIPPPVSAAPGSNSKASPGSKPGMESSPHKASSSRPSGRTEAVATPLAMRQQAPVEIPPAITASGVGTPVTVVQPAQDSSSDNAGTTQLLVPQTLAAPSSRTGPYVVNRSPALDAVPTVVGTQTQSSVAEPVKSSAIGGTQRSVGAHAQPHLNEQTPPPMMQQAQPAVMQQTHPLTAEEAQASAAQKAQPSTAQSATQQVQPSAAEFLTKQAQPSLSGQQSFVAAPQPSPASTVAVPTVLTAAHIPAVENASEASTITVAESTQAGQAGPVTKQPAALNAFATALKAAVAPWLPSVTAASPSAPEQLASGNAVRSPQLASGKAVEAAVKPGSAASAAPVANPAKSPSHVIVPSDTNNDSDTPVKTTISAIPVPVSAAIAAAALTRVPSVVLPQVIPASPLGSLSGGQPGIPADPTLAVQGISSSGSAATPAPSRKPQGEVAAVTGSAQGDGSSTVTAAMPAFARAMEGVANAASAGSLRDPNIPLNAPLQAPSGAPAQAATQASATASTMDSTPISGGSLADLTQARVLHSLSGSEMHINLNSEEFGRVSVHAAYSRESITTQISVENSAMGNALGSALNAHLSTLEAKLGGEHGLPSSVTLATQGSDNGAASQGRGSDPQSQARNSAGSAPPGRNSSGFSQSSLSPDGTFSTGQSTPALTEIISSRLDIRI